LTITERVDTLLCRQVSHFTADKHRTNQSHHFSRSKISIMMCV